MQNGEPLFVLSSANIPASDATAWCGGSVGNNGPPRGCVCLQAGPEKSSMSSPPHNSPHRPFTTFKGSTQPSPEKTLSLSRTLKAGKRKHVYCTLKSLSTDPLACLWTRVNTTARMPHIEWLFGVSRDHCKVLHLSRCESQEKDQDSHLSHTHWDPLFANRNETLTCSFYWASVGESNSADEGYN